MQGRTTCKETRNKRIRILTRSRNWVKIDKQILRHEWDSWFRSGRTRGFSLSLISNKCRRSRNRLLGSTDDGLGQPLPVIHDDDRGKLLIQWEREAT